jgi:hypothetical protein
MTPEERQVITAIFDRLRAAENQPRDPEAERLIVDLVARQPYAPYAMAQAVYVNEQALANFGKRVEQLEHELAEARSQAKPQSGGFFSNLFGGGRSEPEREPYPPQGGGSPWGSQPQTYAPPPRGYPPAGQGYPSGPAYPPGGQGYPGQAYPGQAYPPGPAPQPGPWGGQPQGGGGFLQSAVSTAAGVAGGVVLANMLTSAFSHRGASAQGAGLGGFGTSGGSADDPSSQGFGGQSSAGQGFEGGSSGGRDSGQDSGRAEPVNHSDAAYDRSQDQQSHEDYADDHDPGSYSSDSGSYDSGGDDGGSFSGDV